MRLENIVFLIFVIMTAILIVFLVVYISLNYENIGISELYFSDIRVDDSEYTFNVNIHNLENKKMNYKYNIFTDTQEISNGYKRADIS